MLASFPAWSSNGTATHYQCSSRTDRHRNVFPGNNQSSPLTVSHRRFLLFPVQAAASHEFFCGKIQSINAGVHWCLSGVKLA